MSLLGFLILGIFLWFFYTLTIKVILPVYRTTRQIRQQFKNMSTQRETTPGTAEAEQQHQPKATEKVGEYIDFEEVK